MANLKEIIITLPNNLLKEIEHYLEGNNKNRNQFLSEAAECYLSKIKNDGVEAKMKYGYLEMARLNLLLATDNFCSENETFFNYEAKLAEYD